MKNNIELEWYVLNERSSRNEKFDKFPYTSGPVKPYNIFNNIKVYDYTIKLCKQYEEEDMSFDAFKEELRGIIQWQEWSRREYEIVVNTISARGEGQKIDCYQQVLPNLDILAKYVLDQFGLEKRG